MGLRSPLWMLSQALAEERDRTRLSHLSGRALDLGLGKVDKTRGHLFQAAGAVQQFLAKYPKYVSTIAAASPLEGYKPDGKMLKDWLSFIENSSGTFGHPRFGYNYDTLKGYLTPKYGGERLHGGGGDNEFEICLRLVAAFT